MKKSRAAASHTVAKMSRLDRVLVIVSNLEQPAGGLRVAAALRPGERRRCLRYSRPVVEEMNSPAFVEPAAADPEDNAKKLAANPKLKIPPPPRWVLDAD